LDRLDSIGEPLGVAGADRITAVAAAVKGIRQRCRPNLAGRAAEQVITGDATGLHPQLMDRDDGAVQALAPLVRVLAAGVEDHPVGEEPADRGERRFAEPGAYLLNRRITMDDRHRHRGLLSVEAVACNYSIDQGGPSLSSPYSTAIGDTDRTTTAVGVPRVLASRQQKASEKGPDFSRSGQLGLATQAIRLSDRQ
jgi:hypothetical protein